MKGLFTFFLGVFLSLKPSYAGVKDFFIKNFDLKYTIYSCYVVPEEIKAQLLSSENFDSNEAKLCMHFDKDLEKHKLMWFSVTKFSCHACTPEIWLYDQNHPKKIFFLTEELGSNGEPGSLVKVLFDKNRVILIFYMVYLQMGEEKGSYLLYEFDRVKLTSRKIYEFIDSDHFFIGSDDNIQCTGWKTRMKTDPFNKVISFEKTGHHCLYRKSSSTHINGAKFKQKNKINY